MRGGRRTQGSARRPLAAGSAIAAIAAIVLPPPAGLLHLPAAAAEGCPGLERPIAAFSRLDLAVRLPHAITAADLDGDGDLDLATANGSAGRYSVLLNEGGGAFAPAANRLPGVDASAIAVGDLDGDGALDLVLADPGASAVWILINRGPAQFGTPRSLPVLGMPADIVLADLDLDGDLDAVTANHAINSLTLLFNRGGGELARGGNLRAGSQPAALAAADLDGDGAADLAAAAFGSGEVSLFYNDEKESGRFRAAPPLAAAAGLRALLAADLDGDGWLDFAAAGAAGISLFHGVPGGRGGFVPAPLVVAEALTALAALDLDGDGLPDLAAASRASEILLFLASGRRLLRAGAAPTGRFPIRLAAGDLDGDALLDLACANHDSDSVSVFLAASPRAPDYLLALCGEVDFHALSMASRPLVPGVSAGGPERSGKFLLPARSDPALLPALFLNVRRHPLHQDFLAAVFPQRFPALGIEARRAEARGRRPLGARLLGLPPQPRRPLLGALRSAARARARAADPRRGARRPRGRKRGGGGLSRRTPRAAPGTGRDLLRYLFAAGEPPPCQKAADADDDGLITLGDAVRLLLRAFGIAGPLPEPSSCGEDPTPDGLSCRDGC
jgi:hypothetical protein